MKELEPYDLYNNIKNLIFIIFVLIAVVYFSINSTPLLDKLAIVMMNFCPILILYPFLHGINEHLWEIGYYHRMLSK